jgi:hypothetical protein
MRDTLVESWEDRLNGLLRRVDSSLEARFGKALPIHPARPAAGITDNPQQDGLFRVTSTFTPGFGSRYGRGYVLTIDIVSLACPTPEFRDEVEQAAVTEITAGLPLVFPGKSLRVVRDGPVWKIIGDLSLKS